MPANRDVLDAFNECVDRLSLGQSIEAVLGQYPPRIAAQLRPMLEMSQVARRATTFPTRDVNAARERARAKVLNALQSAPPITAPQANKKVLQFPIRRLLTAAAAVVLALVAITALYPRTETPAFSESLTPPTATPTVTLTPTLTPTPTLTLTPTASPTTSETPTSDGTLSADCTVSAPEGWVSYTVRAGDTLSELAVNTGTTLTEAQTVNCITDPRLLRVGQAIFLPRKPTTRPTSSTPTPSGGGDNGGGGGGAPTEDPSEASETEDPSGSDDDDDATTVEDDNGDGSEDDDPTPEDEDPG